MSTEPLSDDPVIRSLQLESYVIQLLEVFAKFADTQQETATALRTMIRLTRASMDPTQPSAGDFKQ